MEHEDSWMMAEKYLPYCPMLLSFPIALGYTESTSCNRINRLETLKTTGAAEADPRGPSTANELPVDAIGLKTGENGCIAS